MVCFHWPPCTTHPLCRLAGRQGRGLVEPLYSLHAARLKLLLRVHKQLRRAAQQGQQGQQQHAEQQQQRSAEDLALLARHCFLPDSQQAVAALLAAALHGPQQQHDQQQRQQEGGAEPGWGGEAQSALVGTLLRDCEAAMRWALERDKSFHKAARR